jgi:chromosome partitioning protein
MNGVMKIALAGQKGGTGKTTTAISLATEFHLRGRRVLLVDADPQGSARTWGQVAAENNQPAPTITDADKTMHRPGQLDVLAKGFDIVIIDCPPRHGDIMRSALMFADLVILPCGPSAMDAWALAESIDVVTEAQIVRPQLQAAVLITRRTLTVLGKGARETLASTGLPVLGTELGQRITYQEAPAKGCGVTGYAPRTPAAIEIRALVDELENYGVEHGEDIRNRAA